MEEMHFPNGRLKPTCLMQKHFVSYIYTIESLALEFLEDMIHSICLEEE